jgi:environmental stress-induced protein Ves
MIKLIKHNQQITTNWSGGTTTELFIYPEVSKYAARDFLFRISTAKVQTETSSFTDLTGFNRILMLLDGDLTITHNQQTTHHLTPFTPHFFDGAWQTNAQGIVTDFNVIFKPEVNANIEVLQLDINQQITLNNNGNLLFIYLVDGSLNLEDNEAQWHLDEKDFVSTDQTQFNINPKTTSTVIKVTVRFH